MQLIAMNGHDPQSKMGFQILIRQPIRALLALKISWLENLNTRLSFELVRIDRIIDPVIYFYFHQIR